MNPVGRGEQRVKVTAKKSGWPDYFTFQVKVIFEEAQKNSAIENWLQCERWGCRRRGHGDRLPSLSYLLRSDEALRAQSQIETSDTFTWSALFHDFQNLFTRRN